MNNNLLKEKLELRKINEMTLLIDKVICFSYAVINQPLISLLYSKKE